MKHFLRFSQAVKLTNKLHDAPFADLKKRSEYENIEDELQRLSATHLFDVVVRRTDFIGRFVVDVTNIVGSELISQHQDGNYLRQTRFVDNSRIIKIRPRCFNEDLTGLQTSHQNDTSLVLDFIAEQMKPLEVCETNYFINFVQNFTSGFFMIPNKTFLTTMLKLKYESYVNTLSDIFNVQQYLCISVEIWFVEMSVYVGIICHFLNENYHRNSYVLCYKQIEDYNDYKNIALVIKDVLARYKIKDENISFIVTDNTSNFGTIFSNFSHQCIDTTFASITNSNHSGAHSDEQYNENNNNETDDLLLGIQNIKHNWNFFNGLYLSSFLSIKTIKCSTYLLNLVVSFDVTKIGDMNFEQILHTTFKKLYSFWSRVDKSHEDFSIPTYFRWNTVYNSIKQLITKKQKAINLFNRLNISKLNDSEWLFLKEYCSILMSFHKIFDILQNEDNSYLGHVAPNIIKLYKSLIQKKKFKYCNPLCLKLIDNLKTRFYFLFDLTQPESKPYVLAAISHPKFKLGWIPTKRESEHCKTLFLDEFSLYSFINTNQTSCYNDLTQALSYLKSTNKCFSIFTIFPLVKNIFMKYNSIFPSFIPVERLFYDGSQIMSPSRNRINPEEFEMLLCNRCLNLDINN